MLLILMAIEDEQQRSYVAEVYEQNKHKLYRLAYDILKNHHDAEDCVQDVIIALIEYLETYRNATPVHQKNILFRMCRNIAIDKYRTEKRRSVHEQYEGEETAWDLIDDDAYVDALFQKQENAQRLMEMINALGPALSDALYYFYYMRMSTAQIARLLGLSEANVRMRLTRARRMMLSKWEDELYELRKK